MRMLIIGMTVLFLLEAEAQEVVQFKFAGFDDRPDLSALSAEMSAHPVADTQGLLEISLSVRFETYPQAQAACALVRGTTVSAKAVGATGMGVCTVSLDGAPAPQSLWVLRDAAQPVSGSSGVQSQRWIISREATAGERGVVQNRGGERST